MPCTQSNYGKVRSGFDAGDESHEAKIRLGWQTEVTGLYTRDPVGKDERKEGDVRGPSFGPDAMTTYVDDDVLGVKDKATTKELENERQIPRTEVNLRLESSRVVGVKTTIYTFSEEEVGLIGARKGETINVIVWNQRGMLETWVGVWKEKGRNGR